MSYCFSASYRIKYSNMKTSDFYYALPQELIAQQPVAERTQAQMMIVERRTGTIRHSRVSDLPEWLMYGDLLVVNDTRVIPARLFGYKQKTGGNVEILFIEKTAERTWDALCRASHQPGIGTYLLLASSRIQAEVISQSKNGRITLHLHSNERLEDVLEEEGEVPLPPYIKRRHSVSTITDSNQKAIDKERYQTVYARVPGAVAAPTAGLHLATNLISTLKKQGIGIASVTLHVGPGTFKPVRTETPNQHKMDPEWYSVSDQAATAIRETLERRGRIVAVGSTVVRALETVMAEHQVMVPAQGETSLFTFPPYKFRVVDAMLTNFHLPMSTLLMMVSAFAGCDLIKKAYNLAIKKHYRFYSYGDCMLIL